MPRLRTTIAAATGAVALGVGLGVAGLASAAPTPSPDPSVSPSASSTPSTGAPDARGDFRGGPGGRHGDRGDRLTAALAEKLGVDEAEVSDALQAYREAHRPTSRPDPGSRPDVPDEAALVQALAEALDKPEADVRTALDELRGERDAARQKAVEATLAEAVEAGTLTQAEADAVKKAADAGIVRVGR